jgi:hypothetical protein
MGANQSESFLGFEVAPDRFLGDIACGAGEVASSPERRKTAELRIFLPQLMRGDPFDCLEDISGRIFGPDANEQVDMVRLDGQLFNVPCLFGTLGLDPLLAILGDVADQHGLPPLGTPNQVVDDQVDPMLVPLIFHVDILAFIDTETRGLKPRNPRNSPHHWG